jgi:adenylate kinase family enzyme
MHSKGLNVGERVRRLPRANAGGSECHVLRDRLTSAIVSPQISPRKYAMEGRISVNPLDIRVENDLAERVRRLTHRTLLSLLQTFDWKQSLFYSSIEKSTKKTIPPPRDDSARSAATALLAIEQAKDNMHRRSQQGSPREKKAYEKGKKKNEKEYQDFEGKLKSSLRQYEEGKLEAIPYESYWNAVFERSLDYIATAQADDKKGARSPKVSDILREKKDPGAAQNLFDTREAFTCSRVLDLLDKYPKEGTHGDVYMEALDKVLEELTHAYPPYNLFGGASLTGTEPHTFVAYECLKSLEGLADVLEKRAREHQLLAELLEKIDKWRDEDNPIHKIHKKWGWFSEFVASELTRFQNPVGLTEPIKSLKKRFPLARQKALPLARHDTREPTPGEIKQERTRIASELVKALRRDRVGKNPTVVAWLENFTGLVEKKLGQIDKLIEKQHHKLTRGWEAIKKIPEPKSRSASEPGKESMSAAPGYVGLVGMLWRRAFFEGMKHVLVTSRKNYEGLPARADLSVLAETIKEAGSQWKKSAKNTREYLAKLAKWAEAELSRQIALYSLSRKTNFDPVQLAFALRIHHDIASPPLNTDLLARGLQIVVETQQPDGTWPTGAPFAFDRKTLAANYVANVEIMNALMPLIDRRNIEIYLPHVEKVFNWLETNLRRVKSTIREEEITGWSTDRIFETGRIDTWMTAAALQFLVSYRKLLQENVNARMAVTYDFAEPKLEWGKLVDSELHLDYSQRVTTRIYEDFIRPFKETGESSQSAMVLHGPPGTSKSTLAQGIATELGWQLVTITPSDFVKGGIEQSEAAARNLFRELSILREVVVLFDEIDEMLRDRQDEQAQTGIAMLRFLIPGMLTKLQSLKQHGEKNRLIFIVSTNYEDRLDRAITRTGRIDQRFPIVPPDEDARYCLIRNFMDANIKKKKFLPIWDSKQLKDLSGPLANCLAAHTSGWVYKELELLTDAISAKSSVCERKWKELLNRNKLKKAWKNGRERECLKDVLPITSLAKSDAVVAFLQELKDKEAKDYVENLSMYEILERQAALDLFGFYSRREKAKDEIRRVLRSYDVKDRTTTKAKVKTGDGSWDKARIDKLADTIIKFKSNREPETSKPGTNP